MPVTNTGKWIIILIAHDDPAIEPQVIKEQIGSDDNEQLAALCRGGDLIATLPEDTEEDAEGLRLEIEKQCLR